MHPNMKNISRPLRLLTSLPWHASVLIGEFGFVAGKWLLPAIGAADGQLQPLALSEPDGAWLFSAIFLVLGASKLAAQNRRRLPHWRQSTGQTAGIFLPHRQ